MSSETLKSQDAQGQVKNEIESGMPKTMAAIKKETSRREIVTKKEKVKI